ADAVEATGARRSGDLLRIATWRLDPGAAGDGAQFARAAERALAARDPALAERLAGAALQAGAGFAVALARGRNLFWGLDRADDADAVLRDAADAVADAGLCAELAAQRVRLDAGRGRPQEALAGARPLLEDDAVPERARVTAALGAVEALF